MDGPGLTDHPGQDQSQLNGQQGHQHIHADHQHGGEAQGAQTVEQGGQRRVQTVLKQGEGKGIEQNGCQQIENQIQDQARPVAEHIGRQGTSDVHQPVVQGRMDVVHLIIVDGGKIQALPVVDHQIVHQLLPGERGALQAAAGHVVEEGGVMTVGETIGIDLVDKQARFLPGKP